jgi:DNA-binding NarL/FixJ family response regulator
VRRADQRSHLRQGSALDRLSERERQVFAAIARGLSNAEIGRELFVTEHTVKTHVSSLLAKLGLASRLQAVIAAYEWGVVLPRDRA